MAADALRNIARDLFAIEVNTLVSDDIRATRMPVFTHALLDVLSDYEPVVDRLDSPGGTVPAEPEDETWTSAERADVRPRDAQERRRFSMGVVRALRYRANRAARARQEMGATDRALLMRIIENLDLIEVIVGRLETPPKDALVFTRADAADVAERHSLPADDAVVLRKIWEVSTSAIALQTVVHLDGDVVQRVQPDALRRDREGVGELHRLGVQVALDYWGSLLTVARALVEAIAMKAG